VSHNSRCAPFRTVNFARNPRKPLTETGGTVPSGAIASLATSDTAGNFAEKPLATTSRAGTGRLSSDQIVDVRLAIEGGEIVDLLAGADEAGRNFEFFLDGDNDAAFAAAVELGHDEAR